MPGFEIQFEAVDAASPTIQKLSQQLLETAQRSDTFAHQVTLSTQQADDALRKLPASAQQASQSMASLQGAGQQLLNQLVSFATVAGVTAFFKSSADAALEEEAALGKLKFAVNATGGSFDQSKEQLRAFAEQQQGITRFSQTETFDAMSRLVRITGDVNSAMQATRLVFGLAASSGKDFNGVIDLLGPILNGDSTRLRSLRNEFGAFLGDAQTAQQVIDALSKKFIGAAETQGGYGKELAQLRNQLVSFQETVGAGVVPVMDFFLKALTIGAEGFEHFGTLIANVLARLTIGFQALGEIIFDVFKGKFGDIPKVVQDAADKVATIETASVKQQSDIYARYHQTRQVQIVQTGDLQVRTTQKTLDQEKKAAEELHKIAAERLDAEAKATFDRGDREQKELQAKLALIQVEKNARIRALEDLKQKTLITAPELAKAMADADAIAVAKSKEATEAIDDNLLVIRGTEQAVASNLSSSFGRAVADIILTGKSLEDAMKAVFDTILRTAIETFTKIAIERAIIEAGVGGAVGGGAGAGGGLISGFLGSIGLAEGGVVTKPVFAHVGEAGPEAVIPLNRLQSVPGVGSPPVTVNVTQNNTINLSNADDSQIQELMRQMARVTRSGAAAGGELVKSITAQQVKTAGQAV